MKTLTQLIKNKKLDYANPNITIKNFPMPDSHVDVEYELVHFDRYISSEDAITELSRDGWRPATVYDLLGWPDWNGTDWVVAIGSVAEVYGNRGVPYLDRGGSRRRLFLGWFGSDWLASVRFLRVRTLPLGEGAFENETLGDLEKAIEKVKEAGYVIYKEI